MHGFLHFDTASASVDSSNPSALEKERGFFKVFIFVYILYGAHNAKKCWSREFLVALQVNNFLRLTPLLVVLKMGYGWSLLCCFRKDHIQAMDFEILDFLLYYVNCLGS